MSRLTLAVLGTPMVQHGGMLVHFPTRKAEALLIYLAIEGGLQPREKIAAFLWPDRDDERARGTLRSTLNLLRGVLHEGGSPHLQVTRDALGFLAEADTELDVRILGAAYALTRGAPALASRESIARLGDAVGRYRGDFLDGFSLGDAPAFDDWASSQRETWHRRASAVFDRLSRDLSEGGALPEAIEVTTRWVALDSLNEGAHRRLMRLHLAAGDRAAARRAYDACQATLAHELNAEPSPETLALRDRIRAQPLPRRERRGKPATAPVQAEALLVGRLAEHARLVAAYRAARRGATRIASIEGEPGIGKTRLAASFARWAGAQGVDLLQGRAFEPGAGVPYAPIVEALRGWLAGIDDPGRFLPNVWLAELARLLPELRERFPDLPQPLSLGESEARTRLYDAIVRLGAEVAKRSTLVLFIDDLHWADAASLEVLHYATRRWAAAASPILLVVTLRSEELNMSPTLVEWVAGLERDVPFDRIALGQLDREDTGRLIGELAIHGGPGGGQPLSDDLVTWLYAQTGGQPFFIVETIKALAERGDLRRGADGTWRVGSDTEMSPTTRQFDLVTPGIQGVVRFRLGRLSQPARSAIVAGAVLGTSFGFEPLCRVAGIGDDEGLEVIDELVARGVIQESDGDFLFGHDRIREVAYGDAGEARRRVFHRRALEHLEPRGAPPSELARHAYAAGLAERGWQFSIAAGDDAMRVFAVRDAIVHFERALVDVEGKDPRDLAHLYAEVGRAQEIVAQYGPARAAYDALLELARQRKDPRLEVETLNRLATLATLDGGLDRESPAALLGRALEIGEAAGDAASLVDTEWNLSRLSLFRFDLEGTRVHGMRSLQLARDLALSDKIARSLNWLALSEIMQGRWTDAESHADEARDLFAAVGNRAMEGDSLVQLASARIRLGRPREGIVVAERARAMSRDMDNRWGQADAERELALGLLETGEYAGALDAAQSSVASARVAGYAPMLMICLGVLGDTYRRIGLLDLARVTHGEELAMSEASRYPPLIESALAELAADEAIAGNWNAAAEYARRALAVREQGATFVGLTRWYETEALLRVGEVARSAEDIRRFGEFIGPNQRYRIPFLRSQAVLAVGAGEVASAIDNLGEARALAVKLDLPGEVWSIDRSLAELERGRGDQRAADVYDRRASELIDSLASKIGDLTLRDSFLTVARVRT